MDAAIETIRTALAHGASPESKQAAVAACRAILAILEPQAPDAPKPPAPPSPQIIALVSALRGMPMEQILDLAIARLRASLPAGANVAPVAPLKLPIIPIPRKA